MKTRPGKKSYHISSSVTEDSTDSYQIEIKVKLPRIATIAANAAVRASLLRPIDYFIEKALNRAIEDYVKSNKA